MLHQCQYPGLGDVTSRLDPVSPGPQAAPGQDIEDNTGFRRFDTVGANVDALSELHAM